jgi:DHA2 family multidrug resistance protein
MFQAVGLAFLFVPINTAAYSYLPREKNNAASGLMNLARNIGGSVGISVVTTMLARRAQFHQVQLMDHVNPANPSFRSALLGMAAALQAKGYSAADATHRAYALIEGNVLRQANMLAYLDNFWMMGWAILLMVPLVFLMKKSKPGAMAAH